MKPFAMSRAARRSALLAAGIDARQALNFEVHHVVEHGRKTAAPARASLAAVGVGLDDPANLLVLCKPHQSIHTSAYTQGIIDVTTAALPFGRDTMIRTLEHVKLLLLKNGRFP